ncbi:MAG: hypothetical protein HYW49_10185 [Deltaproteobacteria bacterium]|nr:hypothetical protein [Deltaproteobacteria bacterium]
MKLLARILTICFSIAVLPSSLALAQQSADPKFPLSYKVLGRGIENRETHDTLQLACVDESTLASTSEYGCGKLQFLVTRKNGERIRIGQLLTFDQLTAARDVAKALFEDLKSKGALLKMSGRYDFRKNSFFLQAVQDSPAAMVVFGLYEWGSWSAFIGFLKGTVAVATVGTGWGIGAAALFPVLLFLIPEIARFVNDRNLDHTMHLFVDHKMLESAEALGSRATPSWQLRPKKVRSHIFENMLVMLSENDQGLADIRMPLQCRLGSLAIDLSALENRGLDLARLKWTITQSVRKQCLVLPSDQSADRLSIRFDWNGALTADYRHTASWGRSNVAYPGELDFSEEPKPKRVYGKIMKSTRKIVSWLSSMNDNGGASR